MDWVWLLMAGATEIGWMVALNRSEGLSRLWPTLTMLAMLALSMGFLALATRTIAMGTAYAVWTGIGAAGIALVGVFAFGEPRTPMRLACIGLIVLGIVGLKFTSP